MHSNAGFYYAIDRRTSREAKEYPIEKFGSKVTIMFAVLNNGVSRVHVAQKSGGMNKVWRSTTFLAIIWHNLFTQLSFKLPNIDFVKRENNPPTVPS